MKACDFKEGFSASRYRNSPDQMVLPLPVPQHARRTREGKEGDEPLTNGLKDRMYLDDQVDFDPGKSGCWDGEGKQV